MVKKVIILTISILIMSSYAEASSRCVTKECLCSVKPAGPPKSKVYRDIKARTTSVFFKEGSHLLEKEQLEYLYNFFNKNSSRKISIIGYTDGCGSRESNQELSLSRGLAIKKIALSAGASRIEVISAGEKTSAHSPASRRVDIILHTIKSFTTKIEKLPADYYLIDASGSMWNNYRKWSDIVAASVKPGSKIYLSTTEACTHGLYMNQVSPKGGTEIWWSYWHIIDKMKPGETLLIVSDFKSRFPLTNYEALVIKRKVKDAGIFVYSASP